MKVLEAIENECRKLIRRYHRRLAAEHRARQRFAKVSSLPGRKSRIQPFHWALDDGFHPFRVRRRAPAIARAIKHRLEARTYRPHAALVLPVEKPGGGTRNISLFSVADAAVAKLYFDRLIRRNESRLSPYTYAYRRSAGLHDAIERLWVHARTAKRLHLVEFDFSKYFDTISHAYVRDVLKRHFRVTGAELHVVDEFLGARKAVGFDSFSKKRFELTSRGIPQGNCLSLFLANVACHELDLDLEHGGFRFARYADDIVVLAKCDADAGRAMDLITTHCRSAGLAVNYTKSPGITVFSPEGLRAEAPPECHPHFDYVGHRFQHRTVKLKRSPTRHLVSRLSIRPRTAKRLKQKLSNAIYSHLLRWLLQGHWRSTRIHRSGTVDWDVVTCINDLRGYLYGGLTEDEIRLALGDRTVRLHRAEGVMAFFPHVTDIEQLQQIDGWLVGALAAAIKRRATLLSAGHGVTSYPVLTRDLLLDAKWYDEAVAGLPHDVRVPSLVRAWKYARRGLGSFDLQSFPSGDATLGVYP